MSHECPAPGCTRRVPFDVFACREHWFSVPKELRDRLWAAWRHGSVEEHLAARAECVSFLEGAGAASE